MPPKGYKTISLKTPIAERLAKEATGSGIELSVFVDALLAFAEKDLSTIAEWSDFLIWYKKNEAKGVVQ